MSSSTDLACETLYRFLAACLSDPHSAAWPVMFDRVAQKLARDATASLREEFVDRTVALGFGELSPDELDIGPLLDELEQPPEALRDEFVRVFGLAMCRECPPYETEYQPTEEPFFRAQQLADIAGFYRAFGLDPARDPRERPDHVALELEFAAFLLTKSRLVTDDEQAAVCREARKSFVRDHLAWWVPSFSLALRRKAEFGPYAALGRLVGAFLPIERTRLEIDAPKTPLQASAPPEPEECMACMAART